VIATTIRADDDLPLTLPALLRARAGERGDAPLLVCDDDVLTYAGAERRSAELARGLLGAGVGPGSRVGVLHPNGSEFVVAALAAARVGATTVPISTLSTAHELAGLLRGAAVALLMATPSYRSHDFVAALGAAVPALDLAADPPVHDPAVPALRRLALSGADDGIAPAWTVRGLVEGGASIGADVLAAVEDGVTPADRLVVVHTSGSTSEPKGVVHTHGALIRHVANLNEIQRYTADDVLFSNSPFCWIGGFAYSLLGTIVAGACLVCSNARDATDVLDLLERTRPTMGNGFAQAIAHLAADPTFARRDLSSLRRGNLYPLMPADVRPADPELRHAMLGMTETGSVCLVSDDEGDQPEHRRGSFGRPAPGFEARVVDPETRAGCAPGHAGELHLRGPFLMEGYLGRERHEVFDADGWYATGDLVVVDDDGFVYFQGRLGQMIKTAGANVSPREVEAAILDVAGLTAHVVGLDDAARGQIVAAAVVAPPDGAVDVDGLRAALAGRLSAYKVPRRVRVLEAAEVPLTSNGKVDLRVLQEMLREVLR
jgi:acyl-CoA synthetase (AMP-forming)/AMP-acid ligase II